MSLTNRRRRVGGLPRVLLVASIAALLGASRTASDDPVAATRIALRKAKAEAASRPRAPLVAREVYLRQPAIGDVRLSPDGRHLSFLRRSEQGVDLILQDVTSGRQTRIVSGVGRIVTTWSGDGRRLWLADDRGLAVVESGGDGVHVEARRILRWDTRRSQKLWAVDPRTPAYAIIHEKIVRLDSVRHRYLRVDARGATHLLIDAALPLRDALLTPDGALAFTAGFDGPRYDTVIRHYGAAGSRELLRCRGREECRLVGYNEAQRAVWLLSQHGEDKLALQRWQDEGGRWVGQTVHRDPRGVADADTVLWNGSHEQLLAIAYYGGRRRWYGGDSSSRAVLAALEQRLPDANLQLSATTDGRLWLVRAQQGERPFDRYYLYHLAGRRLEPLFTDDAAAMRMPPAGAAMHPVSYRASDGMLLHGYLLLPNGIAPDKAPLIAWLHGGPIARSYDRYDPSIQLLVNRGCAVFLPDFRGSSGYGRRYLLSANGDVGNGRVLADVIDGLDFVLAEGIGDGEKQAVMGVSFGGYASLLAASHHPTRFRFAFAGAPPTDYGWIKQWQAEHDSEALHPEGAPLSVEFPQFGFPYQDGAWREKMVRESPLAALSSVQSPVYIWAGARDDHVPLISIINYVGEAKRLGKSITLVIDPDGGHAPATPLGAEAALYLIEVATHRHFGGSVSPVSPELKSFLRRNLRADGDAPLDQGAGARASRR